MSEILDCAWRGLKWAALGVGFFAGLVAMMAFISWGFSIHPNPWFWAGRVAILIWIFATGLVCANKRGWLG